MAFWGGRCSRERLFVPMVILTLGFEECLVEFQRIMDQMLAGLDFAKCYINNIIIFSLIAPYIHMKC
jgi:hypothetical protein